MCHRKSALQFLAAAKADITVDPHHRVGFGKARKTRKVRHEALTHRFRIHAVERIGTQESIQQSTEMQNSVFKTSPHRKKQAC